MNSSKLSIKITENRNYVSNLNVGYPKLRTNRNETNETEAKLIEDVSRYYLDTDNKESNRETNNNKIIPKVIRERKAPKK